MILSPLGLLSEKPTALAVGSSLKEPTQKQYDTIERFISDRFTKREFYIDFSDTSGRTVYNKQYSGLLRSKNIIEDIKNYFMYGIPKDDEIYED